MKNLFVTPYVSSDIYRIYRRYRYYSSPCVLFEILIWIVVEYELSNSHIFQLLKLQRVTINKVGQSTYWSHQKRMQILLQQQAESITLSKKKNFSFNPNEGSNQLHTHSCSTKSELFLKNFDHRNKIQHYLTTKYVIFLDPQLRLKIFICHYLTQLQTLT